MKKCRGCNQEIDKYAIACEYCGKLAKESEPPKNQTTPGPDDQKSKDRDR